MANVGVKGKAVAIEYLGTLPYINTTKVTRITRWIYLTGWDVANRPARVDEGVKLGR